MYKIPWTVVLMMLNDRSRVKKNKGKESSDPAGEHYAPVTSEEEADELLGLK